MRERTPLPRNVIERLPNLKLIASTGPVNASIDVVAAGHHGIAVVHTGYRSDPTIEFTWVIDVNYSCRSATTGIAGRCQVDGLPRRRCGRSEWEKAACVRG